MITLTRGPAGHGTDFTGVGHTTVRAGGHGTVGQGSGHGSHSGDTGVGVGGTTVEPSPCICCGTGSGAVCWAKETPAEATAARRADQ